MRELKCLHICAQLFAMWCLIVTTNVDNAMAEESSYDSSIQRSNFMAIEPRYKKSLEKQLEDRRSQFLWRMRFDSESLQTDKNAQSQSVGAKARAQFQYKLLENLKFKSKVNLSLESGRSQDIFGDLEPSSGIYPQELKLSLDAVEDHITLEAGQIHQRWLNEPLFIGGLGFPGAAQKFQIKKKSWDLGLITQQLIPTSSTLSTRVAEREGTPSLFTESIQAGVRPSSNNFILGRVTMYKYNDLPSVVAYWSRIYGNTPSNFGNDINNSTFRYDFSGWMGQMAYEQKFSNSFSMQFQYMAMKNTAAPDDSGESQAITVTAANDFGRWIIGGRYKNYFIESDAVPAYYNSHRLGHNNRTGNEYEIMFESKDWGVNFSATYVKADLLRDQGQTASELQQDNQQTFYIQVETMYDFI